MKKYPSYCCQRCGSCIGYLGKIVEFIYYKIFRLKMFKHKCELDPVIFDPEFGYVMVPNGYVEFLISQQRYEHRYPPLELNPTLTCFEHEKIGLIKKNNIKHKFIKTG